MAPKILRASPKPTGRPVKKAKATGKPKGSSPSMVLGSASKAGMQSKQGRKVKKLAPKDFKGGPRRPDFDRPFGKPPRKLKPEFERGTPLPRKVKTPDQLDKFIKKLETGRPVLTPEMRNKLRRLINDRKRNK